MSGSTDFVNAFKEAFKKSEREILEEKAAELVTYIQLEAQAMNEELVSMTTKHGYDFKSIPDEVINGIIVNPVSDNGENMSIHIQFDPYLLNKCSDQMVDFMKEYIIENATLRFNRG